MWAEAIWAEAIAAALAPAAQQTSLPNTRQHWPHQQLCRLRQWQPQRVQRLVEGQRSVEVLLLGLVERQHPVWVLTVLPLHHGQHLEKINWRQ